MREVELDPVPSERLDSLHARLPRVAAAIEETLDWIEADPPDVRAKRRRFSNGLWVVVRPVDGDEWILLWEEDPPGRPVVRFIGESTSL